MSWLRSAVYKAVEASGTTNLSRAVRTYADTVVNQAGQAVISGGPRLFPDLVVLFTNQSLLGMGVLCGGSRNLQSYKLAVNHLEEVSVSCRGADRVQVLRRWLVSLKEVERMEENLNEEGHDKSSKWNESPLKPTMVIYYDHDLGEEPLNFRDVFLRSQALEGITLSLILEEPNDEELSLLLEIYRLCLMGGKDAHDVTVSTVKDLARAFSTYTEEVLVKREELLQYVQDAIAGLKVNSEIVRIDFEVSNIQKKLGDFQNQLSLNDGGKKASGMSTEHLQEDLDHILLCSRLEELLLQKKFMWNGDSPSSHKQKVDKLKILSESLAGSASKAEKRILENRIQKEEALKFRVAKTCEVNVQEQELIADIKALEHRRDELEQELRQVNNSLTSARARLHNAREERDQFDEASNQIIEHFKLKEDELSKSIASYRTEAKVCNTFISFLQSAWAFQSSCVKQKEKIVDYELEKHEEYLLQLAMNLLNVYKEDLGPSISSIRELVQELKRLSEISDAEETKEEINLKRGLEKQYQITSTKIITTFSIVANIKKQLSTLEEMISRKINERAKELFDELETMKDEFESIEKPILKMKASIKIGSDTASKGRVSRIPFLYQRQASLKKLDQVHTSVSSQRRINPLAFTAFSLNLVRSRSSKVVPRNEHHLEHLEPIGIELGKMKSDAEAQLSKLKLELELESHMKGGTMEGNIDWEFDAMSPRTSV